jgi:hypothetical protein
MMTRSKAIAAMSLGGLLVVILAAAAKLKPPSRIAVGPAPVSVSVVAIPNEQRSFAERCSGAGVLVCQGFDRPEDFVLARWPGSGIYPGGCPTCDFRDTSIKASGASSYRMAIPGKSGPRPAGNWIQKFDQVFGEHSILYVSYRFRPDLNWTKINWLTLAGTSPKISIIYNFRGGSCAVTEITTGNSNGRNFPIGYVECGARGLYSNDGNPPYLLQQGDYQCWWGEEHQTGKCWHFPPDEWTTFYYKITIGTWGKPDSTIEAWVAREGQEMEKWIDLPNFILKTDSPGYDAIMLTQFMANKNSAIDHPTVHVWYDDLIVSTEAIPPQ